MEIMRKQSKTYDVEIIECTNEASNAPKGLYSVEVNGEVIFECMSAQDIQCLTWAEVIRYYEQSVAECGVW